MARAFPRRRRVLGDWLGVTGMVKRDDPFGSRKGFMGAFGAAFYYSLPALASEVGLELSPLPYTVRVLLENVLRLSASGIASEQAVLALSR